MKLPVVEPIRRLEDGRALTCSAVTNSRCHLSLSIERQSPVVPRANSAGIDQPRAFRLLPLLAKQRHGIRGKRDGDGEVAGTAQGIVCRCHIKRIDSVMCQAMEEFTGTVPVACEYALMQRWYKQAEAVFDGEGCLVPWQPSQSE